MYHDSYIIEAGGSKVRFRVSAALVVLLVSAARADADVTAFLGAHTNPERQLLRGVAAGFGFLVVGFEFEYADAGEDEGDETPALRTGSANVLLQTPFPIAGFQFYGTTGVGFYRETLEVRDHQETNVTFNTGGGAKITLIGPLRVRLDYRILKLQGDPLRPSTVHRVYAGVNLAF